MGDMDWLINFRVWVAWLSPAALAGIIDAVAQELENRDIGDQGLLSRVSDAVRNHPLSRVRSSVDAFSLTEGCSVGARSPRGPRLNPRVHLSSE